MTDKMLIGCAGLVVILILGGIAGGAEEKQVAFPLEEISAFSDPPFKAAEDFFGGLTRGQLAACSEKPDQAVRAYPKLNSANPLYGSITFDKDPSHPERGRTFHFVLDESTGTGKGYDRLYFDLNGDLDLTNDKVLTPMKDPPARALPRQEAKQKTCFDYVEIPFDYGMKLGRRPFRLLPRLTVRESGYAKLWFIATVARAGRAKIAGHEYHVILGQPHTITGRFDTPYTGMSLLRVGVSEGVWWLGSRSLQSMRCIEGKWYNFSTTPLGEKFFVRPYSGELGAFKVGPGSRHLDTKDFTASGSLESKNAAVSVGRIVNGGFPEHARQSFLPVGDYRPAELNVQFGRLRISISHNYHSDGKPLDRGNRPAVYGIKIRKDKPFVLDFSNEPAVMFASPPKNYRLKLGQKLEVKAVLIDPTLDLMIRDLDDTTRKEMKTYKRPGGTKGSYERDLSLDPTVTITDSSGKKVVEGVAPFG